MEIKLITIGLFIVLLLPPEMKESGMVWATYALCIFAITFPLHVEKHAKKRVDESDSVKRCDCCGTMVRDNDTICYYCKLEASLSVYR